MEKIEIDPKILSQVEKLQEKYDVMGQDLSSYLDGLLYSNYLTYWDYIHLDTLLSLQNPKTDIPDEKIFIAYHQITELYFNLILWELEQLSCKKEKPDTTYFVEKLSRCNRYFKHLVDSFDVMVDGMERGQFLKFRMSLLPSSGFQSVQYRKIEFFATDLSNLLVKELRNQIDINVPLEDLFQHLYWQSGATELSSGKKTLTLKMFEKKYKEELIKLGEELRGNNLWQLFTKYIRGTEGEEKAIQEMRLFDQMVNINWPLAHFKSAARYLQRDLDVTAATGGTNWQKYLPPRFQKRIFYPELWTIEEMDNWGKGFVMEVIEKLDKARNGGKKRS